MSCPNTWNWYWVPPGKDLGAGPSWSRARSWMWDFLELGKILELDHLGGGLSWRWSILEVDYLGGGPSWSSGQFMSCPNTWNWNWVPPGQDLKARPSWSWTRSWSWSILEVVHLGAGPS